MSSRRILYDEMRDKGLLDRCGYARELYETSSSKLKQNCSLIEDQCTWPRSDKLPTRCESLECSVYKQAQARMVKEYETNRKTS